MHCAGCMKTPDLSGRAGTAEERGGGAAGGQSDDFLCTRTGAPLRAHKEEFCTSARAFYREALDSFATDEKAAKAWGAAYAYESDFIDRLSAADSYAAIQTCLRSFEQVKLGALRGQTPEQEARKERRTGYVDEIKKACATNGSPQTRRRLPPICGAWHGCARCCMIS